MKLNELGSAFRSELRAVEGELVATGRAILGHPYLRLRDLARGRTPSRWDAIAFVLIGSVEYLSRSLFWNGAVIRSNEFHTYFRVNSIFWDPNIYGRYLALVLVVVSTAMIWIRKGRTIRASVSTSPSANRRNPVRKVSVTAMAIR